MQRWMMVELLAHRSTQAERSTGWPTNGTSSLQTVDSRDAGSDFIAMAAQNGGQSGQNPSWSLTTTAAPDSEDGEGVDEMTAGSTLI